MVPPDCCLGLELGNVCAFDSCVAVGRNWTPVTRTDEDGTVKDGLTGLEWLARVGAGSSFALVWGSPFGWMAG